MKPARNYTAFFFVLSASLLAASVLPARAQYQPARASVRAVHGSATYSIDGNWQSLKENTPLTAGAIIKTGPDATMDLFLPDSRDVYKRQRSGLLKDVGITAVVLAHEIGRGSLTAQIAVDALVVHVEFSGHAFHIFIRNVGHRLSFVSCTRAHVISVGSASSARFSKACAFEKNRRRNCGWQANF